MKRYAAFLRGVSPVNAKMPELKRAFEQAGFGEVKTLLSSGNVVFSAPSARETMLEQRAEAAMSAALGKSFMTIVRPVAALQKLLADDPYARFALDGKAKRVLTFLRSEPKATLSLPLELDGARILLVADKTVYSAYLPGPRGPAFMTLIEKTFGKQVTTRTWDTVAKAARA